MSRTVFYSWQSDLPNSTNRGFIQDCLERAIRDLKGSDTITDGLDIDRDTLNVQGAPQIAETILNKIERCEVFVADVSIINLDGPDGQRRMPNPNVLIELGYAASVRGWNRVLLVCNTAFGTEQLLPFDLRHRRVVTYSLVTNEDKGDTRKQLVGMLRSRIIEIFNGNLPMLARELKTFFDEIDPRITLRVRNGERDIAVLIPATHAQRLQNLMAVPEFGKLAKFHPNADMLWNDMRGPRHGYAVILTDIFADSL